MMEDMKSILSKIGNASSAAVSLGEIKGVVQRLKEKKRVSIAYSAESKEMIVRRHFFMISDSRFKASSSVE